MNKEIYLDTNASTPIAPEAVEAMRPFQTQHYGNPSSLHWAGGACQGRGRVGAGAGCRPARLRSHRGRLHQRRQRVEQPRHQGDLFRPSGERRAHHHHTAVEHPAALAPCRFLERLGAKVTVLPVDRFGRVDPDDVRRAITPPVRS